MKTIDLAWLAGLFEGEGCFILTGPKKISPRMQIAMTDEDIIKRVSSLTGANYRRRKVSNPRAKPQYEVVIHGGIAIQWMYTLYPLLGVRRRKKVREVIRVWKTSKYNVRRIRNGVCKIHGADGMGKKLIRGGKAISPYCKHCERHRYRTKKSLPKEKWRIA